MAHRTIKSGYESLVHRLNKFPQGAPPSELLFKILKVLFSEREAELVSLLPIKPFTVTQAAHAWKTDVTTAQQHLDTLAGRALLVDLPEEDGKHVYVLPPPMAGFFEFSMMRIRDDIDQKALAELFYQYLNVEEEFIKALFTGSETPLGRAFVQEPMVPEEYALHVLDYERATEVIKTATHIGVSICYCRHKMQHLGRDCSAPKDICMTFNGSAHSLIRHGFARAIEAPECLDLLDLAYEENLVQFGENIREHVNFICNCCGCCCEAMTAARRFGMEHPVQTTNFMPELQPAACTGCGKCVAACPVEAMALVSANDPHQPAKKIAKVDTNRCLGCGVCVRVCPNDAIRLEPRAQRVISPVNSSHRAIVMAIERGKLQNLIFDNQVSKSHRALAALLGVILRLPPIKQAMASQQMKSRYLEALLTRLKY